MYLSAREKEDLPRSLLPANRRLKVIIGVSEGDTEFQIGQRIENDIHHDN